MFSLRERLRSLSGHTSPHAHAEPASPQAPQGWPAGHFYSPIVSGAEIERSWQRLYSVPPHDGLPGISLDLDAQLQVLERVASAVSDQPWSDHPSEPWRYGFDNPYFGSGESLVLLGMLSEIAPRRVIEVGSGWSTRAILDVNDLRFEGAIDVTTVDPFASSLVPDLIGTGAVEVIERPVQEVELDLFLELGQGDVLFIDSSHVLKFGSDVHFLLGEVLPRLTTGVHIHFHDVMYPFEYPLEWIRQGRNWNEVYALRSFLAFNTAFIIELFAAYVWTVAPVRASRLLPRASSSPGSSLWLRRI